MNMKILSDSHLIYIICLNTVLVSCFVILSKPLNKLILKISKHFPEENLPFFLLLAKTIKITLIIIGLITVLGNLGINLTALIASLSLVSFVLGLALKDIISNILAGILILICHPFRLGNLIKVGDVSGRVTDIDFRYITLENQGNRILIPNSNCLNNAITIIENLS